ncbi:SMU1112c/YaeR family gloxylase I-like metalloprotein [Larsenimonas salina]|uniref:SMU1112c/YaeR family gloxylase I-like metalloprotein n=1 Tax=Larsenimonas salina TaxID=1295565 RepID=UPI002073BF7B|nr:VOC family protein [Larsenimonas salina]MCM5705191.1 VOC family protein [Larsenimonas salina]
MSLPLDGIHHVALITADYPAAKAFYTKVLQARVIEETYREARDSYKLDLALPGGAQLELFSFPNPPARVNGPEACGLRHLAFSVTDLDTAIEHLTTHGVASEPVRIDELTGQRFTFFKDPDGTPLEFYERPTETNGF